MSSIVINAEPQLATVWSNALSRDGHDIEVAHDSLAFQEMFGRDPFDILVLDISHADCGEGMLIPQVRATWKACKIVAVVPSYTFRRSAVFEMGLWTPDQVLIKPVSTRLLCATVSFLWAQARSEQIRRETFRLCNRHVRRGPESRSAGAGESAATIEAAQPKAAVSRA